MSRTLEFRPDLTECFLEDRPLLAPVVPTLPWLMITGSNSFVTVGGIGGGGSSLSNLSPLPGPPVMMVGGMGSLYGSGAPGASANAITSGVLFAYYGMGYGQRGAMPSGSVAAGSGANQSGGSSGSPSGNVAGYGATVSSGFGTSLNAANGYGMTSAFPALGQTSSGGTVASPNQAVAQEATPPPDTGNAQGVANSGAPMLGVDVRPQDNLLQGVRTAVPITGGVGR